MSNMKSWSDIFKGVLEETGEVLIACTLTKEEMTEKFDCGYGGTNGRPFTAWSENYVYFPVQYDGAEWIGCAPRNPCDIKTEHVG